MGFSTKLQSVVIQAFCTASVSFFGKDVIKGF
jgi:hypothetical protein